MLTISQTNDYQFIKDWLNEKQLDTKGFHDNYLKADNKIDFIKNMNVDWFIVRLDEQVLAVLNTKHYTAEYIELHVCADPKTRFKWLGLWDYIEQFVHTELGYNGILIYTPQSCGYVIKWCNRLGFEVSGIIPKGMVWRNELNNLIIMTKYLRSDK